MAKVMGQKPDSSAVGWIPEQLYRVRCIGTKGTDKNSGGHPMMTLDCEIIEPETFKGDDGIEKTCAGRRVSLFLIFNPNKTGWASQEQAVRFMENLGLEVADAEGNLNIDTDEHKAYFHGMEFDIPLKSEEDFKKYASGPQKGKEILDGNGQKISLGWRVAANPSDLGENCRPHKNEEIAQQPY